MVDLPTNPVELASIRAENTVSHGFDMLPDDIRLLQELDGGAEILGFTDNTYFVTSRRSMILPRRFDSSAPVTYTDFYDLSFEGRFTSYSKVHIGQIIGLGAVRAVCLTFAEATVLPYFRTISEDELLFVPILAVESIEQTKV